MSVDFLGYWGTASWIWVKVLPSLGDCFVVVVVVVDDGSYLKVPVQVPKIAVGWNQTFSLSTNHMGQYSNFNITGLSPSRDLPKFYFALVCIFLS